MLAREVVTFTQAAGLETSRRPVAGFAASPAFNPQKNEPARNALQTTVLPELDWPRTPKPSFEECCEIVHGYASVLWGSPTASGGEDTKESAQQDLVCRRGDSSCAYATRFPMRPPLRRPTATNPRDCRNDAPPYGQPRDCPDRRPIDRRRTRRATTVKQQAICTGHHRSPSMRQVAHLHHVPGIDRHLGEREAGDSQWLSSVLMTEVTWLVVSGPMVPSR